MFKAIKGGKSTPMGFSHILDATLWTGRNHSDVAWWGWSILKGVLGREKGVFHETASVVIAPITSQR